MKEQYVSFETAKMLKEAGFEANLKTIYFKEEKEEWAFWDVGLERSDYNYFDETIACPTQALAARWLREAHGIHVYAFQTNLPATKPQTTVWEWGYIISIVDKPHEDSGHDCGMGYSSYEAAFEAGLQESIKRIKESKDYGAD